MRYIDYWDVEPEKVSWKTGSDVVMDCKDIQEVLDHFGMTLADKSVLDVGCGTGRMANLCGKWRGVDIAPGMVLHCAQQGLDASLIGTPDDLLDLGTFDAIICLSVFTHISPADARSYLEVFRGIAPELLIDILPPREGEKDGDGSIEAWLRDPDVFAEDLETAGYEIRGTFERRSHSGFMHLYHYAVNG